MKKILIFIVLGFLLTLTACGNKYSKSAYFETGKMERTGTKVKGSKHKDLSVDDNYKDAILNFSYLTASKLLADANVMYSPISFYFALSQLSEITSGDTRKEIMNALLVDDIEVLRNGYNNLYKKITYFNNDSTLAIANSIWLKKDGTYSDDPLKVLADKYYTSSYGVDFSDETTKNKIEDWISDHTGNKLGKGDFKDLDPLTFFVLLNTVYFYDEWDKRFEKKYNFQDNFASVGEVTYMKNTIEGYYLDGPDYESSYLNFKNGMRISFILPNEGKSVMDFVSDPNKLQMAFNINTMQPFEVNYKIPKYYYKSSFNLINFAKSLGIVSVFDNADFSTLTDADLYVSKMFQKSFIEIDEQGGRAAAYTGIVGVEKAAPGETVDIFLNRPFIYAIYSSDYPIFIGVVNNPNNHDEFQYE